MDILENQYIIPVFIGNSEENLMIAKRLYKKTGIKAHIFAEKFSLRHRFSFACHKINALNNVWLKEELLAFANRFEEYYCPVLIICDENSKDLLEEFGSELDAFYLIIDKDELFSDKQKGELI